MRHVKTAPWAGRDHDNVNADDALLSAALARMRGLRAWLEQRTGAPVRLIETHISWLLLTDALAWKLKKPLRLAFLDFTTLAVRRHCCEEEVRLNARLAPAIYLGVEEVREGPEGPRFGGAGELVDAAVRMRRFADGALWSERLAAGTLEARHIDAMAQRLVAFHRQAAVAPPGSGFGTAAVHAGALRRLIDGIDAWCVAPHPLAAGWASLRLFVEGECERLAPFFERRLRLGRVRECHGDLHLGNALILGDEPAAFDGIEFDDALRWIDVLYDVAFLAMDLMAHGRSDLAMRLVDGTLEQGGDHEGLPGLRFFLVARALVRAEVTALGEAQGLAAASGTTASGYLKTAMTLARTTGGRLAITHGLPGSGKSFVSQGLVESAGAIRVRSDVERKRLFGLAPLESSGSLEAGSVYGPQATARTYARLHELAKAALEAGWPVVVDAAFLRRDERATLAELARTLGVPFSILDCRAPMPVLRRRIEERLAGAADASEADLAVLERLGAAVEPLDAEESRRAITIDADARLPPARVAQAWLAAG